MSRARAATADTAEAAPCAASAHSWLLDSVSTRRSESSKRELSVPTVLSELRSRLDMPCMPSRPPLRPFWNAARRSAGERRGGVAIAREARSGPSFAALRFKNKTRLEGSLKPALPLGNTAFCSAVAATFPTSPAMQASPPPPTQQQQQQQDAALEKDLDLIHCIYEDGLFRCVVKALAVFAHHAHPCNNPPARTSRW